jgi:hypothetical protein
MSNAANESTSMETRDAATIGEQEKRKLIQQQLILLLHAYKCSNSSASNADVTRPTCTVDYCATIKEVMAHITLCTEGQACSRLHCTSSRQILTHWKSCTKPDCPMCGPLRGTTNNSNNATINKNEIILNNQPQSQQLTGTVGVVVVTPGAVVNAADQASQTIIRQPVNETTIFPQQPNVN